MFHQFLRQLFQEWRRLAWQHLSVFLPSRAMREHQAQLGAGDRHIKQPPLFIKRPFRLGPGMRHQPILQPHDKHVRKFQAFAGMDGDKRDGVAGVFLFLFAIAVQRDVFQKIFQALHGAVANAVHGGEHFPEVPDAAFGVFRIFFHAP